MLTGAGSVTEAAGIFLQKPGQFLPLPLAKRTLCGIREIEMVVQYSNQTVDTTGAGDAFVGHSVVPVIEVCKTSEIQALTRAMERDHFQRQQSRCQNL